MAVLEVGFAIQPGQILGVLGRNGAGKSTIVQMVTGLLDPSRGAGFAAVAFAKKLRP